MSNLVINGEITRGQDVRTQNVNAVCAVANMVKSSLGPVGLDKMLVDGVGDVTITNDGATILRQLQVDHPAAKLAVDLSNLQDQEVGDGTTSVVIIAAELLKAGNELVKVGVHPTAVINGFQLAKKEACRFIADHLTLKVDQLPPETLLQCTRTSLSSKIIGAGDSDFFAKLAVDAVSAVKTINQKGKVKYPIKAVNILKAHGKSMRDSELVNGIALNCVKASPAMPSRIQNARIALLDFDLRKARLPLGVSVVVDEASKLPDIRSKESDIIKQRIELLLNAGANVILTTRGIDDFSMKWFVERGAMAVRRCDKNDLKTIAKATGGTLLLSLADLDGNETVDPASFGSAELVEEVKVGDGELIYIRGCSSTKAQTIILRGANDYMLDEVERSLHDAMCVVKRVLESKTVVPGGGAVEGGVSVYMESFCETLSGREQLSVSAFAQALLVIPKTLAVNGAFDAIDLVSKLRAAHYAAQTDPEKQSLKFTGLDLEKGRVRDNVAFGVLEPSISKIKMLKFATEAAITILRIDDSIKMNPAEKPDRPVDHDY